MKYQSGYSHKQLWTSCAPRILPSFKSHCTSRMQIELPHQMHRLAPHRTINRAHKILRHTTHIVTQVGCDITSSGEVPSFIQRETREFGSVWNFQPCYKNKLLFYLYWSWTKVSNTYMYRSHIEPLKHLWWKSLKSQEHSYCNIYLTWGE